MFTHVVFSGFMAAVMVVVAGDEGGRWWFVIKDDGGDKIVNIREDRYVRVRSATTRREGQWMVQEETGEERERERERER